MLRTTRILLTAVLAMSAVLPALSEAQTHGSATSGAVFVMTNAADKNEIVAYKRAADGSLQEGLSFPTGGRGSGDISVFKIHGATLALVDRVPCGGSTPVAVAQYGSLVYVANEGAASNVSGFNLNKDGKLRPIAGSTAFLSTANSGAASLSFSPDGQFLLVTEKLTNSIDAFHVQINGMLGPIVVNPAAGPGTFAVLFAPNGAALVAETGPAGGNNASAITSYSVVANGTLSPISTNVPTLASATCWNAVTPNGSFVYTSNAGSATISGFAISAAGALTPLAGTVVGTNPTGSTNLDIAISSNGEFLYTLDSGTGSISMFGINEDGSLTNLGDAGGLSAAAGFNGIAAF